jgi:photosystem II stability/assembly factor-like uncharacterized protein
MKRIYLFLLLVCSAAGINAQWITTSAPIVSWRYDDVYFTNPDLGWAVRFSSGSDGTILKTIDGGASWQSMPGASPGAKYRDVGFLDSLNGFIGTLSSGYDPQDTVIMYQTSDGGTTWNSVTNFPGPRPAGICGMFVVNDSTLYAGGRYYGPAGFYKTTDKGINWSYMNLNAVAGGIVDLHFFNKDTGIAVGGSLPNYLSGKGRILRTVDGGNTWTVVHTSTHTQEICWKVSFPSPNIGYVSLQSFRSGGAQYFLKTTDGGLTWTDLPFLSGGSYNVQGIGFINDTTGWIGGDPFNYKTMNGGLTWTLDNFGNRVNRFRIFGDTLVYAAGSGIYKYQPGTVHVADNYKKNISYLSPQPNPFISETEIHFILKNVSRINLIIMDMNGQIIKQIETQCNAGEQMIRWNGMNTFGQSVANGLYLINIESSEGILVGKVIKER